MARPSSFNNNGMMSRDHTTMLRNHHRQQHYNDTCFPTMVSDIDDNKYGRDTARKQHKCIFQFAAILVFCGALTYQALNAEESWFESGPVRALRAQFMDEPQRQAMEQAAAEAATKRRIRKQMEQCELRYWAKKHRVEGGELINVHFENIFTTHSGGLTREFYEDKKILDLGCGPRGSLEWATASKETICVDPLAKEYIDFGTQAHIMTYLQGEGEDLPVASRSFDVVSSINSLDQVFDLDAALTEIARVIRVGGMFLLYVEVNAPITMCAPMRKQRSNDVGLEVIEAIQDKGFVIDWQRISELGHEECESKAGTKASWTCPEYDLTDKTRRPGYLALRATRIADKEKDDIGAADHHVPLQLADMSQAELAKHVTKKLAAATPAAEERPKEKQPQD